MTYEDRWTTVRVELDEGIAWVEHWIAAAKPDVPWPTGPSGATAAPDPDTDPPNPEGAPR